MPIPAMGKDRILFFIEDTNELNSCGTRATTATLRNSMYRFNNRTNEELVVMTVLYMATANPMPYNKLCGPKNQRIVGRQESAPANAYFVG
jgi:hypothetical protein